VTNADRNTTVSSAQPGNTLCFTSFYGQRFSTSAVVAKFFGGGGGGDDVFCVCAGCRVVSVPAAAVSDFVGRFRPIATAERLLRGLPKSIRREAAPVARTRGHVTPPVLFTP